MCHFELARAEQLGDALGVWESANTERGRPPSEKRVRRVTEKLGAPDACLVVGEDGHEVVAMALAEPLRSDRGAGIVIPNEGHVAMVFVRPDRWGQGIGRDLVEALHRTMCRRGWLVASLWTGVGNERARCLYHRMGYRPTGEVELHGGQEILRYRRRLG